MDECRIQSPVHPARAKVRLRVRPDAAEEAARRLGLPPVSRATAHSHCTALWLAPEQWLLLSDTLTAPQLIERCRSQLQELLHLAVDTSAALECVSVAGTRARTLLAMGSGVDWSPAAVPAGACLRTRFARVAVVVHALPGDAFELYVDRSLRAWLEQWFAHARRDPLLG